ncbi:hypothetical protein B0J14DRAFT_704298 [Halenospora varia]|nr:hypothetical protein B0J14DRAFT_704298 [Halenospora varia]
MVTDYLIAVYSVVKQWSELREYVQELWGDVAYGGLNSAVAGTVSNLAIAMVKMTDADIFENLSAKLPRVSDVTNEVEEVHNATLDVEEQFLIHTYRNLVDFIKDFQTTRSGKPTKPMPAEISNWDPKRNLQQASKHASNGVEHIQ